MLTPGQSAYLAARAAGADVRAAIRAYFAASNPGSVYSIIRREEEAYFLALARIARMWRKWAAGRPLTDAVLAEMWDRHGADPETVCGLAGETCDTTRIGRVMEIVRELQRRTAGPPRSR